MEPEDLESLWFYDRVADQMLTLGDLPIGLSAEGMLAVLQCEGVDPSEWRRLMDDARVLFERLIAKPARERARKRQREQHRARRR